MMQENVHRFWFEEVSTKQWFQKSDEFDEEIRTRFLETHQRASQAELWRWRNSAQGRLAEIIVLDQFSRNIFRNTPHAFAQDALALVLAQEAVSAKVDQALPPKQRAFLYMPYMHSESAEVHSEALRLFAHPDVEYNLEYEKKHKAIIDRFGRYPHRNAALGRQSSPEELEFLAGPGSSF